MDGVLLISSGDEESDNSTSIGPSIHPSKALLRAVNPTMGDQFLPFDVKYFGPVSVQMSRWPTGPDAELTQACRQRQRDLYGWLLDRGMSRSGPEILLCVFGGEPDFVAVVPRRACNPLEPAAEFRRHATLLPYWLCKASPWAQPFMVKRADLPQAMQKLKETAQKDAAPAAVVVNPTVKCAWRGWHPQLESRADVLPTLAAQRKSWQAIHHFWQSLEKTDCGMELIHNPVMPYLGDFYIKVQRLQKYFLIEHKYSVSDSDETPSIHLNRNPWRRDRQWHFLIIHLGPVDELDNLFCIGRHVRLGDSAMALTVRLARSTLEPYRCTTLKDLERYMRTSAHEAMQEADVALQSTSSAATTSANEPEANESEVNEPEAATGLEKRKQAFCRLYERREADDLYGHYDPLLRYCCCQASLVILPLDAGHPLGNCIAVAHEWTGAEVQAFRRDRTLPFQAFSPAIQDMRCVILRCFNLRTKAIHFHSDPGVVPQGGNAAHRWWVKVSHMWTRPPVKQEYLWLGCAAERQEVTDDLWGQHYLFLPSHWTIHMDSADSPKDPPRGNDHKYFRVDPLEPVQVGPSEYAHRVRPMDEPRSARVSDRNALAPKSEIFRDGNKHDDLNNLVFSLPKIHNLLTQLLTSSQPGDKLPEELRGSGHNPDKSEYCMTVTDVHQAAWDYGSKPWLRQLLLFLAFSLS